MQKVIVVVGPTSSGKSKLGVLLAKKFNGEIISADSRQVYKGLDLGTGKITKKEMQGIPHHLINVISPKKQFTASDFSVLSKETITRIIEKNKIPIIVGGTALYIDVLLGKIQIPSVPPNGPLRKKLESKTTSQLFTILKKIDPRRAKSIEPHHKRRLIRAIEIATVLGQSPVQRSEVQYKTLWLGINLSDKLLKSRIRSRLTERIKLGMLKEARILHKRGLTYKRMAELSLEYGILSKILQNRISLDEGLDQLEKITWRYVKRQRRWYTSNKEIVWVSNSLHALRETKNFLK